jgi:protein-S-isoprenylcysteine O-methyltransferase Ste14
MTLRENHDSAREASGDFSGLAGEHKLTDIGQLALLIAFLAIWIADSFVFHATVFLSGVVPAFVRWPVGAVVMAVSALLALKAHRTIFGDTDREGGLVTGGAYAIVRHPMYLGSWLFLVGMTLMTLSLASAAVNLIMLVFYLIVSAFEEKLLLGRFGVRYREYRQRVPRFFPLRLPRARRS